MPNFDALRSAIIGPLEYICKPEPPAELLALYTMDGSLTDLSRYNGHFTTTQGPVYSDDGPLGKSALVCGGFTHPATTNFSIDFFATVYKGTGINFSSGNWEGVTPSGIIYDVGYGGRTIVRLLGKGEYLMTVMSSDVTYHYAFTYDGSKLRCFKNGSLSLTIAGTMNTQSGITIPTNLWKLSNLRVVGKVLGTSSSFPVPSTLYTGYEAL